MKMFDPLFVFDASWRVWALLAIVILVPASVLLLGIVWLTTVKHSCRWAAPPLTAAVGLGAILWAVYCVGVTYPDSPAPIGPADAQILRSVGYEVVVTSNPRREEGVYYPCYPSWGRRRPVIVNLPGSPGAL